MPVRLVCFVFAFVSACCLPSGAVARDPTNEEQLMVEMVNRMRADPAGELARLANINTSGATPVWGNPRSPDADVASALNGVSPSLLVTQWQALTPAPPVAWNGQLGVSSQTYSNVMIATNAQAHNLDSHKKPNGEPDIIARFQASGYFFDGGGWGGENLFAFSESIFHGHAGFAIDWGSGPGGIQNPAGHRDLIMDDRMREIGIGIVNYTNPANPDNSVGPKVITQHFAVDLASGAFLTGVVYAENDGNGFYTPGEGLGGVTIRATSTTGIEFTTTTFASGGYSIEVDKNLTYTLVASGAGLGQRSFSGVSVGADNVKRDFVSTSPPLVGDANMDGLVNRTDVGIVARHFGTEAAALWGDGDFNFDGRVTLTDLALLQQNFTPASSPGFGPAPVPEPSSAASLAAAAMCLVGTAARRTRRKMSRAT